MCHFTLTGFQCPSVSVTVRYDPLILTHWSKFIYKHFKRETYCLRQRVFIRPRIDPIIVDYFSNEAAIQPDYQAIKVPPAPSNYGALMNLTIATLTERKRIFL